MRLRPGDDRRARAPAITKEIPKVTPKVKQ